MIVTISIGIVGKKGVLHLHVIESRCQEVTNLYSETIKYYNVNVNDIFFLFAYFDSCQLYLLPISTTTIIFNIYT